MSREITSSEVKRHNTSNSIWIVIKNDVYDVSAYLHEHPGGEEPLLEAAGLDATRAFEDVGHSSDARSILKKYKIGSLAKGESCGRLSTPRKWTSSASSASHRCYDDEKPWRNFDKAKGRSTPKQSKTSLSKSRSKSPPLKTSSKKSLNTSNSKSGVPQKTSSPRIIPRVPSIVVPRRARRPRGFPCEQGRGPARPAQPPESGSRWKWALLALAAAIIVGVAYKKYASS